MRTAVLCLGLALLCLLPAEAEDRGAEELDESEIAGRWYITALASSSPELLRRKDEVKMAMANITFLRDGSLKISFAIPYPTECKRREAIYWPTDKPGEFYSTDKKVQVLDTDRQSYAVILASRLKEGRILRMLRLYSRTQQVSPSITSLFKQLAKEKGFTSEMIRILPSQEQCTLGEA